MLVNVTTAWCLTCKINEKLVLSTETVHRALAQYGVTFLTADWTNRNDIILNYLQQFDRSGIPFSVLYNRQGETKILPNILTTDAVVDGIRWASDQKHQV